MARIREFKTNFTAGELDPNVNARTDIKYYYNGAAKLRNVYVLPQGGVRRRDGSTFIDTIPLDGSNSPSNTKLVGFQFSTVQRYLIVFYHNGIKVYKDGVLQATIASTYATEDIRALKFTQSLDTLLIFHPDYAPAQLQRGGSHTSWTLSNWTLINVPKYTFPDGT